MRKPSQKPTCLRPRGKSISLPKPTLIIDSMEQRPYSFKSFQKWFAAIERRKLSAGDYSIAGLEDRIAVERKSLPDLFGCYSPYGSREAFVRSCERLSKLDSVTLVAESKRSYQTVSEYDIINSKANASGGFVDEEVQDYR